MSKQMSVEKRLRAHAEALMRVPAGEQWLGAMQSIISIAIEDMARAVEELRASHPPPTPEGKP